MSPHRYSQHAPRLSRLPLSHAQHALIVVLGVIGISLCFGLLRIVAVSGALHERQAAPATMSMAASAAMPDDGAAVIDATFVDVPSASADAISL
jgi:hypothetical protein